MDAMQEVKLTEAQTDALFNYIYARMRRSVYPKHAGLMLCMVVASYFTMRSLIELPGVVVPRWIAPMLAGSGIAIVALGAILFTWAVAIARGNLRRVGLRADLIADFDRYPVRELSRRFDSLTVDH